MEKNTREFIHNIINTSTLISLFSIYGSLLVCHHCDENDQLKKIFCNGKSGDNREGNKSFEKFG